MLYMTCSAKFTHQPVINKIPQIGLPRKNTRPFINAYLKWCDFTKGPFKGYLNKINLNLCGKIAGPGCNPLGLGSMTTMPQW